MCLSAVSVSGPAAEIRAAAECLPHAAFCGGPVPMSPAAENVIERLDGARQKWWLFSLLTTAVLAACVSLAAFLAADRGRRLSEVLAGVVAGAGVGLAVAERRAGGDRGAAAAGRPAKPGGGGPPRRSRVSRAWQQPDQSGAAFRGREEREPGVPRGRHPRGGRADRQPAARPRARPASRARGDCCIACRRRAIWPSRWRFSLC